MSQIDAAAPAANDADAAGALIRRIAFIAVAALVLGFAIQALILATKLSGGLFPATSSIVADATNGIAWSLLICVGVGIITAISKAKPVLAGLLSLMIAPLAVALAKSSQKIMSGLVSAAEQEAVLSLSAVSALRAIEYGVLGWALARLVQRTELRPSRYFGIGALVGLVFGGAIVFFGYQVAMTKGAPMGAVQVISGIINEVLFPIGCAGIIYAGQLVGRSARLIEAAKAAQAS